MSRSSVSDRGFCASVRPVATSASADAAPSVLRVVVIALSQGVRSARPGGAGRPVLSSLARVPASVATSSRSVGGSERRRGGYPLLTHDRYREPPMTDAPADTSQSDTAATLTSVTGSGSDRGNPDVIVGPHATVHPYLHVVAVAVIAAVSVLAWLMVYNAGNTFLWQNAVVAGNPWLFPAICMPFSLLVGLLGRYANAPNNINGSALDSMMGDPSKIDWRRLPISIVAPLASLFSGAVLGPEGGIGSIASQIAAL